MAFLYSFKAFDSFSIPRCTERGIVEILEASKELNKFRTKQSVGAWTLFKIEPTCEAEIRFCMCVHATADCFRYPVCILPLRQTESNIAYHNIH